MLGAERNGRCQLTGINFQLQDEIAVDLMYSLVTKANTIVLYT